MAASVLAIVYEVFVCHNFKILNAPIPYLRASAQGILAAFATSYMVPPAVPAVKSLQAFCQAFKFNGGKVSAECHDKNRM